MGSLHRRRSVARSARTDGRTHSHTGACQLQPKLQTISNASFHNILHGGTQVNCCTRPKRLPIAVTFGPAHLKAQHNYYLDDLLALSTIDVADGTRTAS